MFSRLLSSEFDSLPLRRSHVSLTQSGPLFVYAHTAHIKGGIYRLPHVKSKVIYVSIQGVRRSNSMPVTGRDRLLNHLTATSFVFLPFFFTNEKRPTQFANSSVVKKRVVPQNGNDAGREHGSPVVDFARESGHRGFSPANWRAARRWLPLHHCLEPASLSRIKTALARLPLPSAPDWHRRQSRKVGLSLIFHAALFWLKKTKVVKMQQT